ncbi:MAG TPA: hypothetical protein VLK82_18985 [Candidatus Tectomicrobia bacterium]|nr:hypothetical protein [Candidatus Tectomicrobia bacterium]
MARVADYSIIADGWVVEAQKDTINFEVPSNIDAGSRAILGFMLDVHNLDDMTLTIRLNGTKVWTWNYSGGSSHPARFFQEVIAAGVVKPGTNVFSFDSSSGDYRFVQLSDIVVWWQANI